MGVQVINRWCGPLKVDFGPPLGFVRVPKTGATLDIDFNDLQLPRKTQAMVERKTIELVDGDLEAALPLNNGEGASGSDGEGTGTATSGGGGAGTGAADPGAGTPTDGADGGTADAAEGATTAADGEGTSAEAEPKAKEATKAPSKKKD